MRTISLANSRPTRAILPSLAAFIAVLSVLAAHPSPPGLPQPSALPERAADAPVTALPTLAPPPATTVAVPRPVPFGTATVEVTAEVLQAPAAKPGTPIAATVKTAAIEPAPERRPVRWGYSYHRGLFGRRR